jgi:drug/metabolite transporter (DMT)-like permease
MDVTRKRYLATAKGFAAILLWSTTVAIARSLSESLGAVTAAAAVYSIAGFASLMEILLRSRMRKQVLQLPAQYLIVCGFLFVSYMLLLFLAVGLAANHEQTLEVGLLNYLWPTLTILLSLVLLGKKASWILIPGTLLALSGVFLVLSQGANVSWQSFANNFCGNPLAYSLAILAAVSWALYSTLTNKFASEQNSGGVVIFLPVTAIVLILICCFVDEPRQWSSQAMIEAVFLGFSTYLAYGLWDSAMRQGNVVLVAAGSYLTPLFSTIVTSLYLVVAPGWNLWLGCAVLILGSVLSWQAISDNTHDPTVDVYK